MKIIKKLDNDIKEFLSMKLANTPEKFNIFCNDNCFGIAVNVKRVLI